MRPGLLHRLGNQPLRLRLTRTIVISVSKRLAVESGVSRREMWEAPDAARSCSSKWRRRPAMNESILTCKLRNFLAPLLFWLLVASSVTAQGIPQDVTTLDSTKPVEREMKGGETHVYQVRLPSGQFINISVEQRAIDVAVDLLDPNEKQINTQDGPNGRYGPESVVAIAATEGNYRLVVRAPNKTAPLGRYKISVLAVRDATDTDRAHVAAENAFAEAYLKLRPQRTAASRR